LKNFQKVTLQDIDYFQLHNLFSSNANLKNYTFFKNFEKIISFVGTKNKIFKSNIQKLNKNSFFIFPHNSKISKYHQSLYLINSFPFKKRKFIYADIKLEKRDKKFFIIHPGSGSRNKNVSIDFLQDIENKIKNKFKIKSLWIGGEAEKYLKNITKISILNTTDELLSIISSSIFFIGNDSGVAHLSAACNLLTFTFFGPTSPAIWAPIGRKSVVFYKNLACSPCNNFCAQKKCLKFNTKDVLTIMEKLIEQEIYSCS